MKKFGMILGSIILASALVACGEKKEEAKTEAAPAAEKLSIGLTAYKFDDNFIALFRKAFEAEAAAKADTIEVTAIDSQNSVATEKEQIEAVLEKGVKAFAINLVDASAADGIINLLKEKQSIVMNLETVSKEEGRRIIDTVSGGVAALDGKIVKVTNAIFIAAPENYNIRSESDARKSHAFNYWG